MTLERVNPSLWGATPIVRPILTTTGNVEGDDAGYRAMQTLRVNPSPLVCPNILCRASYDGIDEFGSIDDTIRLEGGLADGALVLRETGARLLEIGNACLTTYFGGDFQLLALDGFRSGKRQAAGFARMLKHHLTNRRLKTGTAFMDDPVQFLQCAALADGTFSYVNLDTTSEAYKKSVTLVHTQLHAMQSIREYGMDTGMSVHEAVTLYITALANGGYGNFAFLPLHFENNAHAGGGAIDCFLVNALGMPLAITPFDYPGQLAGIEFLEEDGNYEMYVAAAKTDPVLSKWLLRSGFVTPEAFTRNDWKRYRTANRILYHLMRSLGCTYYSAADPKAGGEFWHWEPGNRVYDPVTGAVVFEEKLTTTGYPDSGNPGHTLQKLGPKAVAVWGGTSGHLLAVRLGLQL